MAIICYVIAFGDIVGGTAFLEDTKRFRRDEEIDVNPRPHQHLLQASGT